MMFWQIQFPCRHYQHQSVLHLIRYVHTILSRLIRKAFLFQGVVLQNVTIMNAAESKITFIDANANGWDTIQNTNSSNPSVVYDPYYEDIETLDITIISTQDSKPPSKVVLGIFGCADPKKIRTKAQIETTKHPRVSSSKRLFPPSINIVVTLIVYFRCRLFNSGSDTTRSNHTSATRCHYCSATSSYNTGSDTTRSHNTGNTT